MGNTTEVIKAIRTELAEQDRSYAWLARETGVPYKRILGELKHRTQRLTLETVCEVANTLGMDLAAIIAFASKPEAVAA
ncbi:hypothetical protein [Microbacterium sp. KR10-403]|uniref:hypothetical protein n=1 Tax=Microbacterium sp. KR10-403 TaxID=3158581 RepID=UPI0032E3F777